MDWIIIQVKLSSYFCFRYIRNHNSLDRYFDKIKKKNILDCMKFHPNWDARDECNV